MDHRRHNTLRTALLHLNIWDRFLSSSFLSTTHPTERPSTITKMAFHPMLQLLQLSIMLVFQLLHFSECLRSEISVLKVPWILSKSATFIVVARLHRFADVTKQTSSKQNHIRPQSGRFQCKRFSYGMNI